VLTFFLKLFIQAKIGKLGNFRQANTKVIISKPKAKIDSTAYLKDVVCDGTLSTIVPTVWMTAHVKGPKQNEEKLKIDI
jgi:hypothetical protein